MCWIYMSKYIAYLYFSSVNRINIIFREVHPENYNSYSINGSLFFLWMEQKCSIQIIQIINPNHQHSKKISIGSTAAREDSKFCLSTETIIYQVILFIHCSTHLNGASQSWVNCPKLGKSIFSLDNDIWIHYPIMAGTYK